jgi:NADP-dependent 3-hydroxy acid dehydrogenase YdfG
MAGKKTVIVTGASQSIGAAIVQAFPDRGIFITQCAVRQMLSRGTGGSVTSITASLADSPIGGVPASIPMSTKG